MRGDRSWQYIMPFAVWPAADRDAWKEALVPSGLFDIGKPASTWAPATWFSVQQRYGEWLAWLALDGRLDETAHPCDRVTPDRVLEFIEVLRQRVSSKTVAAIIGGVLMAVRSFDGDRDWQWLRQLYGRLKRAAKPSRDKHTRIVGADRLYRLGLDLFDQCETAVRGPLTEATKARDGLIIALLACRPLRLSNLAMMEIGRHLRRDGGVYRLTFTSEETKTSRSIDELCPAELTPYFEKYLNDHRLVLLAQNNEGQTTERLWIDRWGCPASDASIRMQIYSRTKAAFGHKINPHLFRDCVATSIAVNDPEHVRIASVLLGHARLTTTERYYNQAQSLVAARDYAGSISQLRHDAKHRRRLDRRSRRADEQ